MPTNKNNTIFITGGSGFLGINMVRFLLQKNQKVINYDIAKFDYPEKIKIKSFIFVQQNIYMMR